jgi:hypothetical protein
VPVDVVAPYLLTVLIDRPHEGSRGADRRSIVIVGADGAAINPNPACTRVGMSFAGEVVHARMLRLGEVR